MPTSFQEFLREKAEGSDWKARGQSRREWLDALKRLLDQIRGDLRAADPDDLLEIVPYEVERVEGRLGIYDAPALKIRLGTDSVDVLPVGRYAIGPIAPRSVQGVPGGWSGGRVDITNGEKRYMLLQSIEAGKDRWYALEVGGPIEPAPLDRGRLEAILQDLLK